MIEIKNLTFAYQKGRPVFENLNLSLHGGHIYGLLGKNGSGKSTLLKNIAGLAFPQLGHCLVSGKNSSRRDVATLEQIYFIPEEIFVPPISTHQFLKTSAVFYPKFNVKDFYSHLNILDVDPEAVMTTMSYGQQKKVMIAFGLATNTNILIMDEPTNGLDIPSKVQFRKLIVSAVTNSRCIIISTHQVRDLDSLIDFLLILDHHNIVVEKSLDELTELLEFGVRADTANDGILYHEKNIKGNQVILQNRSGQYGKIDLELLFNGVTNRSEQLLEVLKSDK